MLPRLRSCVPISLDVFGEAAVDLTFQAACEEFAALEQDFHTAPPVPCRRGADVAQRGDLGGRRYAAAPQHAGGSQEPRGKDVGGLLYGIITGGWLQVDQSILANVAEQDMPQLVCYGEALACRCGFPLQADAGRSIDVAAEAVAGIGVQQRCFCYTDPHIVA